MSDNKETALDWINKEVSPLIDKKFYGKLNLVFENGNLVHVKKEEGIKPPWMLKNINIKA